MTAPYQRQSLNWSARLLIGLLLILVGAAAATWALARYDHAARFLGVASPPSQPVTLAPSRPPIAEPSPTAAAAEAGVAANAGRIAELEARLARVENATQRAEGQAGRADALLIAFAVRRSVERGVALGYLEPLLVNRFGAQHPRAVATIVTGSRSPVRINELISDYENLGPMLRSGGPQGNWWGSFRRELGSLVEIHRADQPATRPEARYNRALARLQSGEVESALAETMRMPGAANAQDWVAKARRYISLRRALDEIESSALLAGNGSAQ
ncbi:MAG TPA: hypothetical protein VNH53_10685 [Sphingomicrobium sp.]|jgi:hypothetical protein|nr:hypothetical protein [Sphingomicrobium sp.]